MKLALLIAAMLAVTCAATASRANEFEAALRDLAQAELVAWVAEPELIAVLQRQNAANTGLTQADIDALDTVWQAEVGASASPTIDKVLDSPISQWLRGRKDTAGGLITEVFVTDNRGLNAAQSDVTSDYWQGDEAKWSETFGKASGAIHLSDVGLDESKQTYQSQISLPVNDPGTGDALGAVTFGVNVELLQ